MASQRVRIPSAGRSKYGAKRTAVDGITFHSAKEARRYAELKLLEKAGEIRQVTLQVPFCLVVEQPAEAYTEGTIFLGTHIGNWLADFTYYDTKTGAFVVEDVKGFKTPLYRWKKKHVEAQYGISIREV